MADTRVDNRMTRALAPIDRLPSFMRTRARSFALGRVVKFVGTAGLSIEELTPERAVVFIANRARVQNHIGGVHAAAMALVAETATGFVVGLNLPDASVPVIKSMHVDFVRRARGSLRAVAEISAADRDRLRDSERGEVTPTIVVTDEAGEQPIKCTMIWAWTPKRK